MLGKSERAVLRLNVGEETALWWAPRSFWEREWRRRADVRVDRRVLPRRRLTAPTRAVPKDRVKWVFAVFLAARKPEFTQAGLLALDDHCGAPQRRGA